MQPVSNSTLLMESMEACGVYFSDNPLSMEGTILYPQYYRHNGLRRAVQMVAPTLRPVDRLELPRDAVLHAMAEDESQYGISQDDPILAGETRMMSVEHIVKLAGDKGPPRSTARPVSNMTRDYRQRNRRIRQLPNIDAALRDPASLLIENYGLLPHLYRYTQTFFASYNKWWNIQATVWHTAAAVAEKSNRHQFMVCHLPTRLPTLTQLNKAETVLSRAALAAFSEPSALFILEMWKWFGAHREGSLIGQLSQEQLNKINLVWIESGQWFVMNLGMVNQWRKGDDAPDASVNPQQMQRRFLRLLMFLQEARTTSTDVEMTAPSEGTVVAPAPTPTGNPDKPLANTQTVQSEPVKIKIEKTENSAARTITLKPGMNIDVLPDHPIEETQANIQAIDDAITRDLEAMERLMAEMDERTAVTDDSVHEIEEREVPVASEVEEQIVYRPEERTLEQAVMDKVDALANKGQVSAPEYRRFLALSSAYKKLPDPYGKQETMEKGAQVHYKDALIQDTITVPDQKTVFDKSMLKSSLLDFDPRYVRDFLPKDIVRMGLNVQNAGVCITGWSVEDVEDAMGHYEVHSIQVTPVRGKPSTWNLRIPKVREDGTFKSNGVRYLMRKQRTDKPIRKISPSEVSLTSYYSKTNVKRSEKKVHNYTQWLTDQIAARGMDENDQSVTNIVLGDVFNTYDEPPRIYSVLAQRFRSFRLNDIDFMFDYRARAEHFGAERVADAEKGGMTVMGVREKNLIVVDRSDTLYEVSGDLITELGRFEGLAGLRGKQPMEMTEVKISNKDLPVGIVLAYLIGLEPLMALLKLTPRRIPAGERLSLSDDDFALRFEDVALVFPRDNKLASMVLSGFMPFENSLRNYPAHLFDKKDIYLPILEANHIGLRYLREMDLMNELFVDPITKMLLEQMGEPTTLVGLLVRSCELLLTDWAPAETDMNYMRSRGYERVAGVIYAEMVRSIRQHRAKGQQGNSKLEMPPYAVWQAIQQDGAVKLVEESNPIHNLKEKEEITFSGTGGRSGRSMVARTRQFHKSDLGVISEATKDSSDVAITTFMTANPNLVDLYGNTRPYDPKTDGPASLMSTTSLFSPCIDRDDGKRVNFASIQHSSGTFAKGYGPMPLRTGYDQIIAHRTDDLFATTAKQDGKVVAINKNAIVVENADGSRKAVQLGRRFGTAAGSTFPHELTTTLKVGDKVRAGDAIAYNSRYFAPDPLNPRQVLMHGGVMVRVAIMDTADTLEDSSVISQETADLLETEITKPRDIVVKFSDAVHHVVGVGDEVDAESILCTIEDAVSADSNLFGDDSIDVLRQIAANNPKAKFKGKVEGVEVFYHGDIEDLSPSLQELAIESDRDRRRLARDLSEKYTSGSANEGMRVDGNPLAYQHAVIRVYITGKVPAGVGDKGVYCNQLKTIFGRVMTGVNTSEDGQPIGGLFGYQSISARIVNSAELMLTTNAFLYHASQLVADAYFGDK